MPIVDIDVLAKTSDPVRTDARGRILPDKAIKDAQAQYDLLFIGGGEGCTPLMEDPEVLGFLQDQAPGATWITSVCVGAFVLGAAGLLQGYKAATYWSCINLLPPLGATLTHERVVFDRNRITGGGVTAGIDFGLAVVGKIWGEDYGQLLQLIIEYNPQGLPEPSAPAARVRQ